jgi:pimeloyl-ACP methyl ester carboxylesterase
MLAGVIPEPDIQLVRSSDGTFIAGRSLGGGKELPLLLANAVGADLTLWRHALVDLVRERTCLTWDHRGLFESGAPAAGRVEPAAHAEDAEAVLDDNDVDRCVVLGWSNGARIALEIAARQPERVAAAVLVCGGPGQSLDRLLRHLELGALLPPAAGLARRVAPLLQIPFRALVARPELAGVVRQTGLLGPTADGAAFVEFLRALASCDLAPLLASYEALTGGAGEDPTGSVSSPLLVIAGGRDPIAPPSLLREMQAAKPSIEMEVYEDAGHFLPIEHPVRLSDDLRRFFASALPAAKRRRSRPSA